MFTRPSPRRRPTRTAAFARLEALESRVLCDATIGKESPGGQTKVSFVDLDGTNCTFSLTGPGQATIVGFQNSPRFAIRMTGTTDKSSFTIKTDGGGDGECELEHEGGDEAVLVNGSLKSFSAKSTDVFGDFTLTGTLATLLLNDINDSESDDNVHFDIQGAGATETSKLKVTMEWVDDMSFKSAIPIGAFTIELWDDTLGSEGDVLEAPSIDTLKTKGNSSDRGRWEADITLTNAASLLKTVSIAGTFWHGSIRTPGDIGAVTVGAIRDAAIFAGVDGGVSLDSLPTAGQLGGKSIKSFTIKKPAAGQSLLTFRDSRIAAKNIGPVKIQQVGDDGADAPFGIVADVLKSYASSTTKVAAAPLGVGGDFDVQGLYSLKVV